jgi:hypothetical protein
MPELLLLVDVDVDVHDKIGESVVSISATYLVSLTICCTVRIIQVGVDICFPSRIHSYNV